MGLLAWHLAQRIQAAKPTRNAFIEGFHGCFRDVFLNDH